METLEDRVEKLEKKARWSRAGWIVCALLLLAGWAPLLGAALVFKDDIKVNGKAGIGTAATFPLDVQTSFGTNNFGVMRLLGGAASSRSILLASDPNPRIEWNIDSSTSDKYVQTGFGDDLYSESASGDLVFRTAPSGTAGTAASLTERARIGITGVKIGSGGTAISKSLRGTISWNPGTLNTGACANNTITVTGTVAGTECAVSYSGAGNNNGMILSCQTSTDTCNISLCNPGSSTTGSNTTYICRTFNP